MKNSKSVIIFAMLGFLALSACTDKILFGDAFLEKQPGVDMTQDTIFSRREYARRFLWNTYSMLYYGLPVNWDSDKDKMGMGVFETLSDCWHSHLSWDGVNGLYYSGTYNANQEDNSSKTKFGFTKEKCWEAIRSAWLFIENVDRVPDMDEAEKARLKAEAKVIIVSRYFDMFRHFGGVPLVDGTYDFVSVGSNLEGTPYYSERGTIENTVKFMTDLLDDAAKSLPWNLKDAKEDVETSNWDGRFTKAAALGLKCKILIFAASPLFNSSEPYCSEAPQEAVNNLQVWYGGYKPEVWNACLQACKDFFEANRQNGDSYHLCMSDGDDEYAYRMAFRNGYFTRDGGTTENNPEMLISTRVRYTWNDVWDGSYYFIQACKYGAITPTQEYVEMFPWADGKPFEWEDESKRDQMFVGRDPRLYETILVEGAEFQGRQAELWIGGREAKWDAVKESESPYSTGYALYKYRLDEMESKNKPTLWPYLRMSEIYLIYAEALLQTGDLPGAISWVNKVRARVGLKGLEECNPDKNLSTNKDALLEEILRERACELGLEDVRFFDMIRYKRADLFVKRLHGILLRRADGKEESWSDKQNAGPRPAEFTYEKFELKNKGRMWWNYTEETFPTKWYLSAFPVIEVNKGYGLVQNPGW